MRALTLWQPWCWAMTQGIKLVENRTWKPPDSLVGQDFALHAGKRYDQDSADTLRAALGLSDPKVPDPSDVPRGAITAVARLARVVTTAAEIEATQRRFFFGPYGWVLEDVRRLPRPILCRGFQFLWEVPALLNADIRAQLAEVATTRIGR